MSEPENLKLVALDLARGLDELLRYYGDRPEHVSPEEWGRRCARGKNQALAAVLDSLSVLVNVVRPIK